MRIALGGVWHETNSFIPGQTTFDHFRQYQFAQGQEVLDRYRGTGTELGGAIGAADERGIEIIPLAFAGAIPSGLVTKETFDHLIATLISEAEKRERCDGAVLILHGAMCVEGCPDPETELVGAVRGVMGDIPLAATLDLHANTTHVLSDVADILVGYDTYPHVDMAERGAEALQLVHRMLTSQEPPNTHLEKLPLLTVPQMQDTREEPMRSLVSALHQLETQPGVWTASLLPGFAYCDVDRLGFSVYVAADSGARELAQALASEVWLRRQDFTPLPLLSPAEAVREADSGPHPAVLVDVADNVGGGSPGNGTVLLGLLEDRAGGDAVVVIWDPETITAIYGTGDRRITVDVGDRVSEVLGPRVRLSGYVSRHGHVTYVRTGSYMRGQAVDMGRVAVIESSAGKVVVTENRITPFDDDHLRVLGIQPEAHRILVAKSATAWKAAFGSYAARSLFVRTPGYCPGDLSQLTFTRRPQPLYPLELDTAWSPLQVVN